MTACIPCLHPRVKDYIKQNFDGLDRIIAKIIDCPDDVGVNLCDSKGRIKKAPSQYNLFMKSCLLEKKGKGDQPTLMKRCAGEWRQGTRH